MSWNPVWEEVFATREWGRYPPEELVRFVARRLYPLRGTREVSVLELGCGTGANLWYLAREGIAATGVDGSATAAERARARLRDERLEAEVVVGDVADVAELLADRRFDAVVDVSCLQHNERSVVEDVAADVRGLLRPGGRLFSMLVMRGSWGDGLGHEVAEGSYVEIPEGPVAGVGLTHFWSLEEVEALASGFADAEIERSERTLGGRRHRYGHWLLDAGTAA